jgi:hypothetical protein
VLRPALIGTRNDLLRLRRGIEQGINPMPDSSLDSEDSQKSDAMKNFEANLDPMTFLIEQLGPTEAWRSAESFSRIVNSCTKAGSVDEKRFERLMRAGSKLNLH